VHAMLLSEGFTVGLTTVRKLVAEWKPFKNRSAARAKVSKCLRNFVQPERAGRPGLLSIGKPRTTRVPGFGMRRAHGAFWPNGAS
jgi:hypothetical protein